MRFNEYSSNENNRNNNNNDLYLFWKELLKITLSYISYKHIFLIIGRKSIKNKFTISILSMVFKNALTGLTLSFQILYFFKLSNTDNAVSFHILTSP